MRTKEQLRVFTRWQIRRDFPEILSIEFVSFGTDAWTEDDFLTVLRERNSIGMVAEIAEKVVAVFVYETHSHRLELLNLAVDPAYRRRGVASQCIAKLAAKLNSHRRSWITANVSECDLAAQMFLKAAGFRATAVLKRMDKDEADAYRFVYSVDGWTPAEETDVEEVEIGEEHGGEG